MASGTQRVHASHLVLLVGEGFGEECDDPIQDAGLVLQRLTTAADVGAAMADHSGGVRGLVVREGASGQLGIEALDALRRESRDTPCAAVVRTLDSEFHHRALVARARCLDEASGVEATWRAVRYVAMLGAKVPGERRARVERFTKRHLLTPGQREYVDLISREIPFADMHLVFGVCESTKLHHFRELRDRVGVTTRDELCWHFWNDGGS